MCRSIRVTVPLCQSVTCPQGMILDSTPPEVAESTAIEALFSFVNMSNVSKRNSVKPGKLNRLRNSCAVLSIPMCPPVVEL